jgi:helix-turn-helix protein
LSVESISRALRVDGIDAVDKLLLVGIANHDGDGGAWPAMATLAGYLCRSERSTQRHLANLVELGLVEVEHNAGGNGHTPDNRRPNRYILHFPPVDNPGSGVTRVSPLDDLGVTKTLFRGDKSGALGVTQLCHPNRPLEPSLERAPEPTTAVDNYRTCADCRAPLDESRRGKWRCADCQAAMDQLRFARLPQESPT